jgi:hypothetical protein
MAKDEGKEAASKAAGREAAGKGRTKDLSKDLYRRMCKEAMGGHLLGIDEETEAEVFVLHVEMPQDLWEALHDDPATLIEWINDNEEDDGDEDDDESEET